MKIYVSSPGDPSVGIHPDYVEIEWHISERDALELFSREDGRPVVEPREEMREYFRQQWYPVFQTGPVSVMFDSDLECMADQDAER